MGDYRAVQIIVVVVSERDNPMTGEERKEAVAHADSYTFLQTTPLPKILLETNRDLRRLEDEPEL